MEQVSTDTGNYTDKICIVGFNTLELNSIFSSTNYSLTSSENNNINIRNIADSGYTSISHALDNTSLTIANRELLPSLSNSFSVNSHNDESDFFQGTNQEYLLNFLSTNWLKWDRVKDIRNKLHYKRLEEIRSIFWEQNGNEEM